MIQAILIIANIVTQGDAASPTEELIYYERPDTLGPKTSKFFKVSSSLL